jgi:6-pyruvoyltetrahydropterin/6-carboxytetrahydropterin synthase
MHGHSYAVCVTIEGVPEAERGWIMDFAAMDEVVDPVIARLDHQVLNEIAGLDNPTAENLAAWLWRELDGKLPLAEIQVSETGDARCILRRG